MAAGAHVSPSAQPSSDVVAPAQARAAVPHVGAGIVFVAIGVQEPICVGEGLLRLTFVLALFGIVTHWPGGRLVFVPWQISLHARTPLPG
jgi:hypothetical protein